MKGKPMGSNESGRDTSSGKKRRFYKPTPTPKTLTREFFQPAKEHVILFPSHEYMKRMVPKKGKFKESQIQRSSRARQVTEMTLTDQDHRHTGL